MEDVLKLKGQYTFSTSTAEVSPPEDFVVEFIAEQNETDKVSNRMIKIHNIDELIDFLEQCDC